MDRTLRIDVGWGAAAKAVAVIAGVLFLLLAAAAVAVIAAIIAAATGSAAAAAVLGVILGGVLLCGDLLLVLRVLRLGARLEGTTLVVTGAFGTRRCDLGGADVSLDSVSERNVGGEGAGTVAVPVLTARDAGTGTATILRLRTPRGLLLPPQQLDALAAAIEAGRRAEPAAGRARQVATAVRNLSAGLATGPAPPGTPA